MDIPATSDNIPGTLVLRDNTGGFALKPDSIINADIDNAAAIAGTKIAPDFGSQNVATTGTVVAGAGSIISGSSSDAALRITQTGAGNALVIEDSTNPDASPVVFNTTGVQVAGHTSAISAGGGSSPLQLHSSGNIFATQSVATINWGSGSAGGGGLITAKARSNGARETYTTVQSADDLGNWRAFGADGTGFVEAARISVAVDGTPGTNDMPGRLAFSTTADGGSSPTERMRIDSAGRISFPTLIAANNNSTDQGVTIYGSSGGPNIHISNNGAALTIRRTVANGSIANFYRQGTVGTVGNIAVTTTATAFNTSSDYRLKQNIEPMVGGLAKLAALSPKTFEFINQPAVKVDGFIAHEVAEVIPQAVTGEKDGEEMQGLDMSKLVPVLVAAVQELSAKVAALEST